MDSAIRHNYITLFLLDDLEFALHLWQVDLYQCRKGPHSICHAEDTHTCKHRQYLRVKEVHLMIGLVHLVPFLHLLHIHILREDK